MLFLSLLLFSFFFFFNDTATTEIYTLSPTRRSSDLARRAPVVPAEEGEDRFLRRVEDLRDDIGVDLPQDVLEHLPRLPPVDARGRMLPRDLERRESRDLVPLAFLAVRAERGFGTAVVESRFE